MSPTSDGCEPVQCKVLDCDTVTQAKEKALDAIYRNTPFSQRPSVHDLDLGKIFVAHIHRSLTLCDCCLTYTFVEAVESRCQFFLLFQLLDYIVAKLESCSSVVKTATLTS